MTVEAFSFPDYQHGVPIEQHGEQLTIPHMRIVKRLRELGPEWSNVLVCNYRLGVGIEREVSSGGVVYGFLALAHLGTHLMVDPRTEIPYWLDLNRLLKKSAFRGGVSRWFFLL